MVGVDYGSLQANSQSISRLAWTGVGGCLEPFYIHQMNRVNSCNDTAMMTAPQTLSRIIIIFFFGLDQLLLLVINTCNQ